MTTPDKNNDTPNGNIMLCHKNIFVSPSEKEYDLLKSHIDFELHESHGQCILSIGDSNDKPGLNDNDLQSSLETVEKMTGELDAVTIPLVTENQEGNLKTQKLLIRSRVGEDDFVDIRVAVVGNVDAGKSTLLGVLTHGELDNGRGLARQKLFRHKHEMESGRTSSVGNDILGFDLFGHVVDESVHGHLDWKSICTKSAKVVTFIDLAGHERYLKTTVFGMTGYSPQFAMLMIGANAGCIGMTKEHLGLALALGKPVFVVITKIDMCPKNVFEESLGMVKKILKSPGCRKAPFVINNNQDVIIAASNFAQGKLCPIFCVSNVEGTNLPLVTDFLSYLTPTMKQCVNPLNSFTRGNNTENNNSKVALESLKAEFQIDEIYSVPGVGTVVSGICMQGLIRLNDVLLLGPDAVGNFVPVPVKSIHRKRMPVSQVRAQQTASFSLKRGIKRSTVRKGMVLVAQSFSPVACWEFLADVLILHHPTTIAVKYQAMVHVGSVRQTATIIEMDKDVLRTGDKALVRFRFIKQPEYLGLKGSNEVGRKLIFREGKTKAVGTIREIFPSVSPLKQAGVSMSAKANLKQS